MSLFVAELEKELSVNIYHEKVNERNNQAFVELETKLLSKDDKVLWVNFTDVKMPPIYLFTFIWFPLWLLFGGLIFLLLSLFFATTYLFFWRGFHVWAFKRGLKKSGYKGTINIYSTERSLREVFFNDGGRGI